jgi:hypothetical protein
MRANHLPLPDLGNTGILPLLAERLGTLATPTDGGSERERGFRASEVDSAAARATESQPRAYTFDDEYRFRHFGSVLGSEAGRALVGIGLWARAGFVGASLAAIGLVQLFDASNKPLYAVALAVAGGVLAAFAWQRAGKIIAREDAADANAAPDPESTVIGTA